MELDTAMYIFVGVILVALIVWYVVTVVRRYRRKSPKWRISHAKQETATRLAGLRGPMNVQVDPEMDFTSIELLKDTGYIVRNIGFDTGYKRVYLYTSPGIQGREAPDQRPFTSYGAMRGQPPTTPGMNPSRVFSYYDLVDCKVSINGRIVATTAVAITNEERTGGRDALRKILTADKPIKAMHMTVERRNSPEGDFFFPVIIGDIVKDTPETRQMASELFSVIFDIVANNINSGAMPMPNSDGSINLGAVDPFSEFKADIGGEGNLGGSGDSPFSDF
ncbi:MAG: hypothetical protein LUD29_03185 [Clostridia bacterium]|nr:hypothetical protein [Clostridia bacterium]